MTTLIIENLTKAIRSSAVFNPDVQVSPSCILWPDGDRQWEPVIQRLQSELPELFILGDLNQSKRMGPAIWLRCVIAGTAPEITLPNQMKPIFYLPGVRRQDLRAVENCPDHLKPLAELQYRGVIWAQLNAKDWTILAFLKSDQGGLGLDVAQDNSAKHAMQLALYRLLDEDIGFLKDKRLDKDFFNTILTGGDPIRDLLQWLDQGAAFQAGRDENAWRGFVEVSKSQLGFNPENDGDLVGATKLANREGPWRAVWDRYCEAPKRYLNIPKQIRRCQQSQKDLFSNTETHGGWPQWNESEENDLRLNLLQTQSLPPHKACQHLKELDKSHQDRRSLVWAELGEAPLSCALDDLCTLADVTEHSLAAGDASDLVAAYQVSGWRADAAVLAALFQVKKNEDFEAVQAVIRAIYLPWAEDAARHLQTIVDKNGYPGGSAATWKSVSKKAGECVMFVDGLRFDIAKRFVHLLTNQGYVVEEQSKWSALPSITATGKAAVSPVRHLITGQDVSADFEPCVMETGKSLKGGYYLRKLLEQDGWQILEKSSNGDPVGSAWCAFGDIDHEGHDRGWKLVRHLDTMLDDIKTRVDGLLATGWKSVRIVTDHGWLLMPGGLPKIGLPPSLSDNTWGRCAAIKAGASSDERLFPWSWNTNQSFALADGISCYRDGLEYAHGGLSLQECLTLELTVYSGAVTEIESNIKITDTSWVGMRCKVAVEGDYPNLFLDIRTHVGNSLTSIVMGVKAFKKGGICSVVVEDEELDGTDASIVIIDGEGNLMAQLPTVIGAE
jgi:hypothetical protein